MQRSACQLGGHPPRTPLMHRVPDDPPDLLVVSIKDHEVLWFGEYITDLRN